MRTALVLATLVVTLPLVAATPAMGPHDASWDLPRFRARDAFEATLTVCARATGLAPLTFRLDAENGRVAPSTWTSPALAARECASTTVTVVADGPWGIVRAWGSGVDDEGAPVTVGPGRVFPPTLAALLLASVGPVLGLGALIAGAATVVLRRVG